MWTKMPNHPEWRDIGGGPVNRLWTYDGVHVKGCRRGTRANVAGIHRNPYLRLRNIGTDRLLRIGSVKVNKEAEVALRGY